MTEKIISVIIPTTDPVRMQYLEEALCSINEQDIEFDLFEVIVVTNYTVELNRSFDFDLKIVKVLNTKLGHKLSVGMKNANGGIISFLEDDDTFVSKKLSLVYKRFMDLGDELHYHKHALNFVNEIGKPLKTKRFQDVVYESYFGPGSDMRKQISPSNCGNFHSVLSSISVRRSLLQSITPCLEDINFNSDFALLFAAIDNNYGIYLEKTKLTNYRIHQSGSRYFEVEIQNYLARTKKYFDDIISTTKSLKNCANSKSSLDFLKDIKNRQELDYLRWRDGKYKDHILAIKNYLIQSSARDIDFRFLIISVLFFLIPKFMRPLYIKHQTTMFELEEVT